MTRFRFAQRAVLVVVLAAVLAAPAVARSESRPRSESQVRFVSRVLQIGVQLRGFFVSFWEKEGCHIDPHGACLEEGSATELSTETDAGCVIDPHGGGCTAD